ncbi:MAG: FecR domain-containing protein [Candidatus Omnitrophota bacterium]
MKKYFWMGIITFFIFVMGMSGSLFAGTGGAAQAGVAAAVKGDVKTVTPPGKAPHTLKSGDKVFVGDKIETGMDGRLQVLLLDQTVFTLGPLGAITVDEFVYNPSNDDGKVKASVMKGIFRVVSGEVAHKKPENMSVDLPAGAIGFRGTNVAGIIDGKKSMIVLLGPVGVGHIYVTNVVNGKVVGVDIDRIGNATIVNGPNSAPVHVFQVSEADLSRIARALGQQMSGGGASGSGTSTTGIIAGTADQDTGKTVDTQQLLNLLNTVDDLNQTSTTAAQDSAQESAKNSAKGHSSNNNPNNNTSNQYKTISRQ